MLIYILLYKMILIVLFIQIFSEENSRFQPSVFMGDNGLTLIYNSPSFSVYWYTFYSILIYLNTQPYR